jgi:hypothetical protein
MKFVEKRRRSAVAQAMAGMALLWVALFWVDATQAQRLSSEAVTDGWLRDAQSYSEVHDTSVEEALRRLQLQGTIGALDEILAEQEKETFAGRWIEHEPEFRVVVRFTDPKAAAELLSAEALGELVSLVEVRGAVYSLAELERRLDRASKQLEALGARADYSVDVRQNRVEVRTPEPEALAALLRSESAALPEAVSVVEVGSLLRPYVDMIGGRPLTGCTAGFVVENGIGQLGLTSAAHCPNASDYEDTNTDLTFRSQSFGGSQDVQWHQANCDDELFNRIDDGIGIRSITGSTSRSSQSIGTFVCKHGMITGRTCGDITSKTIKPNYVPGASSTFISVENGGTNLGQGGDSGAPWFTGNQAYGIMSGGEEDGSVVVYMAVNYMSALGLTPLRYALGNQNPSGVISCWSTTSSFNCQLSGRRGLGTYTYDQWSYYGPASSWSGSGTSASGSYSYPGCPSGSYNSISARVTDSCGRQGYASTSFFCPY